MNKQTQVAMAIVKFGNNKTVNAIPATEKQVGLYEMGEELGYSSVEYEVQWSDALRLCKSHEDRCMLRAGFVSAYGNARKVSEKAAQNRFDYLARKYSPQTSRDVSRKARTRKVGGGRKVKVGATKVNASERAAVWNAAALTYVSKMQRKHAGDDEVLEILADLAAILQGRAK